MRRYRGVACLATHAVKAGRLACRNHQRRGPGDVLPAGSDFVAAFQDAKSPTDDQLNPAPVNRELRVLVQESREVTVHHRLKLRFIQGSGKDGNIVEQPVKIATRPFIDLRANLKGTLVTAEAGVIQRSILRQ